MSKYVRKRRTPGAEETWGNQGSVGSLSEEEVDGPNKRFVGIRGIHLSTGGWIHLTFFFLGGGGNGEIREIERLKGLGYLFC